MPAVLTENWKYFKINDLFRLCPGKSHNAGDLIDGDDISYIGAKKDDNGYMKTVSKEDNLDLVSKGNAIIFIRNGQGSVGFSTYQEKEFIGSGDITAGYNPHLNRNVGLFLETIIDLQRPRYSFGRKWSSTLPTTLIKLPADGNGDPDWAYMDSFIASLNIKKPTTSIGNPLDAFSEMTKGWKWKSFSLADIFSISYGNKFDLNKMTFEHPEVNFISRTGNDNGVSSKVDLISGKKPYQQGSITVALGGSIGSSFYQDECFYTGQNVSVLQPKKDLGKLASLFVCTQIENECAKRFIAFGRELNIHIKRDFTIGLPEGADGKPDWNKVVDFMKRLPFSDKV
jgi:hypothetical protein